MTIIDPQPPFTPYAGWLLEEDYALKNMLKGVTVTDVNADGTALRPAREVKVWFRNPEMEKRKVTYPHLMIDFLSQKVASEREHRGWVQFGTEANTANFVNQPFMGWYPIPLDLDYQITAGSRDSQHDRQLIGQLMQPSRLHPRFASLTCGSGTVRRLDVLQQAVNGDAVDGEGKRLFRKIWTIRVSAELTPDQAVGSRVSSVILTLKKSGTNEVLYTKTSTQRVIYP